MKKLQGDLTVLGFDYGTKKIGIAVGQTVSLTASPIGIRPNGQWQKIAQLIATWKPQLAVVGEPLEMDGSPTTLTRATRRFAQQLNIRYGLRVFMWDERLTSYEARSIKDEDKNIDDLAACLILESWLRNWQKGKS